MKRLPDRTRLDVVIGQSKPYVLARRAKLLRIDGDAGQPIVGLTIGSKRHKPDAGRSAEHRFVTFEIASSRGDAFAQTSELTAPNGGQHVTHPIVKSNRRMLVVRRRIARLHGEEPRALNQVGIVGNEHPAPGGGNNFVAVKREDAATSLRSNLAPLVSRSERLRRILDDGNVVKRAGIKDRLGVGALTVEVYNDNPTWQAAIRRTRIKMLGQ